VLLRLGRRIPRWPLWVALGWLVAVALAFAAASGSLGFDGLFDRLHSNDTPVVPGESKDGLALLRSQPQAGSVVMLLVEGADPADPAVSAALRQDRARLTATTHVAAVSDPQQPAVTPSPFVSADGSAFLVSVSLQADLPAGAQEAALGAVERSLDRLADELSGSDPAVRTTVGGVDRLIERINQQVEADLRSGEAVALPISLALMVLVFGGLLAAGLPVLGAVASIAGALACLLGFSLVMDLNSSVPSVVSVLGLGLCIDYGLLLVSRYREEARAALAALGAGADDLARDRAMGQALERTMATAGRTVLFSGLTVAISLCGLLFFRTELLRAVDAAGVSVVLIAVLVAITLIPALLALTGRRLVRPGITHRIWLLNRLARRLGDVAPQHGAFSRLAAGVQRRPGVVILACLAVLAAAAWPLADMRLVASGTSILPVSSDQRHLFDTLDTRFPALTEAPILVVCRVGETDAQAYADRVSRLDGVRSVDPVTALRSGQGPLSVFGVRTVADPQLGEGRAVVDLIRRNRPDFEIWVTGRAAQVRDFVAEIRARAPLAGALVALATLVLLFLMTGSVLIPLKALAMNAVSMGASFGVLVWIFQEGHLEGFLGFTSNGGVDQTIPALVLSFAFGLSMDYEVFLLSRVKEARDRGAGDNDLAVRQGLQHSGRIITSAALIVVIVFAGFATGELLIIKEMGVALAVAVAVDATVVRMLLVPATMTLLGEWNWWAPAPLRRLHTRFGLREN